MFVGCLSPPGGVSLPFTDVMLAQPFLVSGGNTNWAYTYLDGVTGEVLPALYGHGVFAIAGRVQGAGDPEGRAGGERGGRCVLPSLQVISPFYWARVHSANLARVDVCYRAG